MDHVQADIYAIDGNAAVVRLPARQFPGILVQGDTMKMLAGLLKEAAELTEQEASRRVLEEAGALVNGFLVTYETALRAAGERLPYATG